MSINDIKKKINNYSKIRGSGLEVFCKKGDLKIFANFTEKYLFFKKVARLRKTPVKFAKFSKTYFFIEHLRWLLLEYMKNKINTMN